VRLSVVIPARDEASVIPRCLESLLAQAPPDVEVIVADDGSRDGTPDLAARRFPRVRVLRLEARGSAAARNAAIREARAPRLALLDADCVLLPGWVDAALADPGDPSVRMGRVAAEPSFVSRLFALLEFGEFTGARAGPIAGFAYLNLSAPAEVLRRHPCPEVSRGADRLHSWQLARAGVPIRFDPSQAVVHAPRTGAEDLLRRHVSYARRFLENRRRDPSLPGGRLARLGPPAAGLVAAGRLARDLERLLRSRAPLGIGAAAAPAYLAALALARLLDAAVMAADGLERGAR
jgi:glycosyltransferase involved in cell wall biosynthesis